MSNQKLLRYVTYCGLYCGLCANRNSIPQQARQLEKTLYEEDFNYFYYPQSPFWKLLQQLSNLDCACRTGCGPPDCDIRNCAKQKGVEVCPQCSEYPCTLMQNMAEVYPNLIQDGRHLQRIGLEEWVKEQDERAKRGFVYGDIRIPRRKEKN